MSIVRREYKVVILGSGGVGKSALTVRFVHSLFVEKYGKSLSSLEHPKITSNFFVVDPTVEDSYRRLVTVDNITVSLEIMDTAGTEQFLALHSMYMKSGDGFLLVFSLTSLESIAELKSIREQIQRIKEVPTGRRVPMVLVGNKCDLVSDNQSLRLELRQVAIKMSQDWGGIPYFETSARKDLNVRDVFEDLVRQMIKAGAGGGRNSRANGAMSGDEQSRQKRKNKRMKCTIL
ncbi:Ras- protein rsr1 [Microbotryomycetes sp. JL221]|nr:Ras- protein rsr1 [Microbotryomycetes sp. JL221]